MTAVHYIWIGPRPPKELAGFDTVGPDLMHLHDPQQEIHFYCLDEMVAEYTRYFAERSSGKQSIHVHGIETFVAKLR